MQNGEPFNPHGLFVGVFIPNVLLESGCLSPTAMLLWARMAQFAGRGGRCFPKQTTLAKSLHITTGRVKQLVKELEEKEFIRIAKPDGKARLLHAPNEYQFLWHPAFEEVECLPPEVEYIIPPGVEKIIPPREETQREEKPLEGTRPTVRTFTDTFCQLWEGHYGSKYPFAAKDGVCANKIWKLLRHDWQLAKRVLQNYFADSSDFFKGHSMGKLLSQLPVFLPKVGKAIEKAKPIPTFLASAEKVLRSCNCGGRLNIDHLVDVIDKHWGWVSNAKKKAKRLLKNGNKVNLYRDIRPGFLVFLNSLSVSRYVDWIADQVQNWDQWGGSLTDFHVRAKHWQRFIKMALRGHQWTPNKAERKVMDEA